MADQYTVELGFNRPPEDLRRMCRVLRSIVHQALGERYIQLKDNRFDILYRADLMDEIANIMEEGQ